MFFKMKKFYRILPFVLIFLSIACNQKTFFMNIEEIPLPPEAQKGTISGRYEVELDGATNTILSELKKSSGKTEEKILFLPGDAEAAKIFEFYAPKLTERGFTKDSNVPLQGRNYQINIWKNQGQTIAVAVIDAGKDADGKAIKFLAIYLGIKP